MITNFNEKSKITCRYKQANPGRKSKKLGGMPFVKDNTHNPPNSFFAGPLREI